MVVIVSTLIVRAPLLLAYFRNAPGVLDYLPLQRVIMSALIIVFCSVQVSLVLHNETFGRGAFALIANLFGRTCFGSAGFCSSPRCTFSF